MKRFFGSIICCVVFVSSPAHAPETNACVKVTPRMEADFYVVIMPSLEALVFEKSDVRFGIKNELCRDGLFIKP